MLGLKLRKEFAGPSLKGTVVSLNRNLPDSFINIPTKEALEITYPTVDVLQALEACFNPDETRYLVIMGGRGQGKSHIMGVIHHAFKDPNAIESWLDRWKPQVSYKPKFKKPKSSYLIITAALHEQEYEFLWSPLFELHPEGKKLEGKWEANKETRPVPSKKDLLSIFEAKPTVLILDEFQTWFSNLSGKPEDWAFNFIQILSDIAAERPDLLRLIVSVRDGESNAYKQLHRYNPRIVNFRGDTAKQDRQKLLIHRLFENRSQISSDKIKGLIEIYFSEWCRLMEKQGADQEKAEEHALLAWPYAQDLLDILEEQISLALNTQETRDLILVLAHLFKGVGESVPVITPSHFGLDDEKNLELDRLIAAVGTQESNRLAKIALQNIKVVREALGEHCPSFAEQALASLYIRSLTIGQKPGSTRQQLQADLSFAQKYDDIIFKDQWQQIADNSYNVHPIQDRFAFKVDENPRTKVLANAKNQKLFDQGQDQEVIRRVLESTYAPRSAADRGRFRYCILGKNWKDNALLQGTYIGKHPTQDVGDGQACFVFVPEPLDNGSAKKWIGSFLNQSVSRFKNLCRFLIPNTSIYSDKTILLYARAYYFAHEWRNQAEYARLADEFERQLSVELVDAYDHLFIVEQWDAQNYENIKFSKLPVSGRAAEVFGNLDRDIEENFFSIDEFNQLIEGSVKSNNLERQKFSYIRSIVEEPRPFPSRTIPWTSPNHILEVIKQGCKERKYAIKTDSGLIQVSSSKSPEQIDREIPRPNWNRWDTLYVYPLQDQRPSGAIPTPVVVDPGPGTSSGTPITSTTGISEPNKTLKETGFNKKPVEVLGDIERWGAHKNASLHDVSVTFKKLSGEELRKVLEAVDRTVPESEVYLRLLKEES